MTKIEIIHDSDVAYGIPDGTIISAEKLLKDFRDSDDCDDSLYDYLCRIPIPAAVDIIAEKWGLEYKYV